ncbi:hypothetical protein RFI_30604 [Reticulomyxa filosa]|uniref:Uncharacterized protein n=1 Tax=Reticulomyxa filosa TaxID=46433 RepID=X6M1C3_RETFI|nr:hypothetical protein RFI_30604 [Reticulomyxa filosa]|eukprot:ETO06790.1 hypothetical protein RFI_30604 [Reticulomyxa filosa]
MKKTLETVKNEAVSGQKSQVIKKLSMQKYCSKCISKLDSNNSILPMFLQVSGTLLHPELLPNKSWILFRGLLTLSMMAICINSIAFTILSEHTSTRWYFIFYGNWILWLTLLYFLTAWICSWKVSKYNSSPTKVDWVSLTQLKVAPVAFLNRICLYISKTFFFEEKRVVNFEAKATKGNDWSMLTQILDSGVGYLLLWLDYLNSLHEMGWFSVLYALGSAALYLLFTLLFEYVPGVHAHHSTRFVHDYLQWRAPSKHFGKAIVISLIMFVVIFSCHVTWVFIKRKQLQCILSKEVLDKFDNKQYLGIKTTPRTPTNPNMGSSVPNMDESITVENNFKKKIHDEHHPVSGSDEIELNLGGDVRVTHDIIDDDDSSEQSDV